MGEFFLEIVNMSITASWIILAVVVLRLLLKKAPKWMNVLLWGVVGLRLVLPFSLESIFSLIPSAQTVSPQILTDATPQINTGIPSFNNMVNPVIRDSFSPNPVNSATPLQIWSFIAAVVWLAGIAVLVLYSVFSYLRVKRKVVTAVLLRDNIYQSENVGSPFVLGIFKPKIYLPFAISEQDREQVIAHETAHIRRKDYLWKPLGFFLLTLHWFNPLIWLSYLLLCRDIELACDEKVIKNWDDAQKAEYSQALLNCSVHRKLIAACPLAFGEVSVKNRVKSVLHYKKPAFWLVVTAVVVSIAVGVCFLTNPATVKLQDIEGYGIHQRVSETTSVLVGSEAPFQSVTLNKELLEPLFNLKISAKKISNDRSMGRDYTNSILIHTPKDTPSISSFVSGIAIHFNKDFTEVWASDSSKQGHYTFSYQVKNPEKAKEVYETIANYNSSTATDGGADGPQNVTVSDSKAIVTYRVVEEDELGNYQNGIHYYDTEVPNTPRWHIVLEFAEDIKEFCFYELDESEVLRKGNALFELKAIVANQPVLLHTYVNDITRNRGISFQDAKGNFHNYAFTCDLSGRDSLLQLEDIQNTLNSSPAININELLTAVLDNREKFVTEEGETCYLKDFQMGDPVEIDPKEYALVDFDGDGNGEAVVSISESHGFHLVLHCNNTQVFGHVFSVRALQSLKTDGTFVGSGGAATQYYCKMHFENNQPVITDEAIDDDLSQEYQINGRAVTKEEIDQFTQTWYQKQDVQWFLYFEEDNGTLKTFRDVGVSFQIPSQWDALKQQGEDGRTYFFREPTLGEQCQLTFSVTGSEYQNNRTKDEYLAYLSENYEEVAISSYQQESLSGYEGTKIEATYLENNQTFVRIAYENVVAGVRMYEFIMTYPKDQEETYKDIFDAILRSITITE